MYSIDDTTASTVTGKGKVIKIDLSDYSKVGHGQKKKEKIRLLHQND